MTKVVVWYLAPPTVTFGEQAKEDPMVHLNSTATVHPSISEALGKCWGDVESSNGCHPPRGAPSDLLRVQHACQLISNTA